MGLRNWARRVWASVDARRRYVDLERPIENVRDRLATTTDPDLRAIQLAKLASLQLDQANVYTLAFGADITDDGMDAAQSLRWVAFLYRLLADVEQAVAYPHMGRRQPNAAIIGEDADSILDQMAATPDLYDRSAYLIPLHFAVTDKVGGEAAVALLAIPCPQPAATREAGAGR